MTLGLGVEAAEVINLSSMGGAGRSEQQLGERAGFVLLSRSSRSRCQVSPYRERLCFIYQTFLEFLLLQSLVLDIRSRGS